MITNPEVKQSRAAFRLVMACLVVLLALVADPGLTRTTRWAFGPGWESKTLQRLLALPEVAKPAVPAAGGLVMGDLLDTSGSVNVYSGSASTTDTILSSSSGTLVTVGTITATSTLTAGTLDSTSLFSGSGAIIYAAAIPDCKPGQVIRLNGNVWYCK